MTGLLAVLLLLSADAGTPATPDGGVTPPPGARSAEDEEVIQNLDLLEHLAESQALEMMLELEESRPRTDR